MPSDADIQRWLILDQETDREDWRIKNENGLVLSESGFTEGRPAASHSAAIREICVVFLRERDNILTLPEAYSNEGDKRCRVWCHYGRDISTAELKQRWGTYSRLTNRDKDRLLKHPRDFPMPFSKSQPLPWSPEFSELKGLVSAAANAKSISKENFGKCLGLLQSAWDRAGGDVEVSARILQNKTALPAQLSAHLVLDSMPDAIAWGLDTLAQVLEHCRRSGLSAAAADSDGFSRSMKDAYRKLQFHLLTAKAYVKTGKERLAACAKAEKRATSAKLDWNSRTHFHSIREALEHLLQVGTKSATRLSNDLTNNPSRISG